MNAAGPGQLLFSFVRHWSRRTTPAAAAAVDQGRLVLVTEAVAALAGRGRAATVNAVAAEIGLDQSGASRLVTTAVDAGLLTMTTARSDGRRRQIAVTGRGRTTLERAHAWQELKFDELTEGWSRQRRDDFRSAMADLLTRSWEIDSRAS